MKKAVMTVFLGALILGIFAGLALGQGKYPTKPIEIIVPYSPGGGTDIMFRNIEKIISQYKLVPQPINIINRGGGGGAIGKAYCLSKPADGYTFTCFDLGTVSQQIEGKAKWDFRKDFSYIARLVSDINLLIVRADAPYKNVKELVEAIKQKGPKSISVGGTATYAADHFGNITMNKATKQEFGYVPFNSGGEVLTNLLGGHIQAAWANPNECVGQLDAKQVKILAVATEKRSPLFPDQPTFREQGYDVVNTQTRSIVGRAGIPQEAIDFWVSVLGKVRETPEWKDYLRKNLLEDGWLVKEEFFKDAENDYRIAKAIMDEAGVSKK
ncbi:MAG: tripartite tricarboxylate transporter substrate binding protein [Syntrophaceae bacterium]|nr:tripartite tricarboxylate transporter substrate binding protein [Syntrophaceae bacterium]